MPDPVCPRCGHTILPGSEIEFDAEVAPDARIIVDGPGFHHKICPTAEVPV